jgi:hypothetical protein
LSEAKDLAGKIFEILHEAKEPGGQIGSKSGELNAPNSTIG